MRVCIYRLLILTAPGPDFAWRKSRRYFATTRRTCTCARIRMYRTLCCTRRLILRTNFAQSWASTGLCKFLFFVVSFARVRALSRRSRRVVGQVCPSHRRLQRYIILTATKRGFREYPARISYDLGRYFGSLKIRPVTRHTLTDFCILRGICQHVWRAEAHLKYDRFRARAPRVAFGYARGLKDPSAMTMLS